MKEKILKRKPLGNPRFQWKQKDFILSTFSCQADDMDLAIRNLKEAGFNLVELGWATHEQAWTASDMCEKHGLDLVFQDMSLFGGTMNDFNIKPTPEEQIRKVAEEMKNRKHTIGYYVWDEPYVDEQFAEARRQSDILQKYDPEALMFTVFLPSYNPDPTWENGKYEACFEEYVQRLDPPVLSFDFYPYGDCCEIYEGYMYDEEKQLDDSVMWLDLALARKLSNKYNLPFWFYYQSESGLYNSGKLSFPMIQVGMYIAAMYGAKGLQNYQAADRYDRGNLIKRSGEKGPYFEETKNIHKVFKNLGETLMALNSKLVYHSDDIVPYGPHAEIYKGMDDSITDSNILTGALPKRTSVGELEDEYGNRYLMIVNRDVEKELNATLPMKEAFRVYEVSKEDGKQKLLADSATELNVNLLPGDGTLLRIQPLSQEAELLQYSL